MPFRRSPEEVFLPRKNYQKGYPFIPRVPWQEAIRKNINSGFHGLLVGESGVGKTWLLSHLSLTLKAVFATVDCRRSKGGDLEDLITNALNRKSQRILIEQEDTITGGLPGTVSGSTKKKYSINQPDALSVALSDFLKSRPKEPHVIILDNAESLHVESADQISLCNLIVSLGSSLESSSQAKLIVISGIDGSDDIINGLFREKSVFSRLQEIHPLTAFSFKETVDLLTVGLQKLRFPIEDDDRISKWARHIFQQTLGIPVYVQLYSLKLTEILKNNNWIPPIPILDIADEQFILNDSRAIRAEFERIIEAVRRSEFKKRMLWVISNLGMNTTFTAEDIRIHYNRRFTSKTTKHHIMRFLKKFSSKESELHFLEKSWVRDHYRWSLPQVMAASRLSAQLNNEKVTFLPPLWT